MQPASLALDDISDLLGISIPVVNIASESFLNSRPLEIPQGLGICKYRFGTNIVSPMIEHTECKHIHRARVARGPVPGRKPPIARRSEAGSSRKYVVTKNKYGTVPVNSPIGRLHPVGRRHRVSCG